MPVLATVHQTMRQRIDDFYANASIFKTNRFFVGFWGDYVDQAIGYMEAHAEADPRMGYVQKKDKGFYPHVDSLNRWKTKHCYTTTRKDGVSYDVELKWTCSAVTIPHIRPSIDNQGINIDAYKPIDYPLITGYGGKGTVSLTIVEDRDMNMYQFFNALQNQFFGVDSNLGKFSDPRLMTPRSSFQRLGMYIAVVQEEYLSTAQESVVRDAMNQVKAENGTVRQDILDDVVVQVFEFNSIAPIGITETTFDHGNKGQVLAHNVQFSVPNTFQQPYKMTFRGLRNNTSDPQFSAQSPDVMLDSTVSKQKNGSGYYYNGLLTVDNQGKLVRTDPKSRSAFEDERYIDDRDTSK